MEFQPITREEAAKLPPFNSHREARLWFKIKYGDAFQIDDSFIAGEGDKETIIYRYNLILNRKTYDEETQKLIEGSLKDASRLLSSYQSLEISLEGDTHIVF